MAYLFVTSLKNKHSAGEGEEVIKQYKHWAIDVLLIGVGLVGLVYGSNLLVDNAIVIAQKLGMSEALIGLTIVAAGTSMPELATSVVAALKKRSDIAIGTLWGQYLQPPVDFGVCRVIYPIRTPDINIRKAWSLSASARCCGFS